MNTDAQASETAIRRCVALYNRCTTDWIDTCYDAEAAWTELPTATTPHGRRGGSEALRDAAAQALALFPDRQLAIRNLVAQEQQVAVELDWSGTAARAIGRAPAGAVVHLRIASFFTIVNGLITAHTDYCLPGGGSD